MTKSGRPPKGSRAPDDVSFYDKTKQFLRNLPHDLSQAARATATVLFLHAHDHGGSIYVSVETVMDMTGLSRSAQFRAFKELLSAGYLVEDGWHAYPNGVKTRQRRLRLDLLIAARAAERGADHSATNGTVQSPTNGTVMGAPESHKRDSTVPQMGPKPSLNQEEVPSSYCEAAREGAQKAMTREEAAAAFDALFGVAPEPSPPPAPDERPPGRGPYMPRLGDPEHRWAHFATSTEIDPRSMNGASVHYRAGWALRQIALLVANEVGWYAENIRPNWQPLLRWLDDGLDPHDHILPTIRRIMARQGASGAVASLAYFDRAVREAAARPRRAG